MKNKDTSRSVGFGSTRISWAFTAVAVVLTIFMALHVTFLTVVKNKRHERNAVMNKEPVTIGNTTVISTDEYGFNVLNDTAFSNFLGKIAEFERSRPDIEIVGRQLITDNYTVVRMLISHRPRSITTNAVAEINTDDPYPGF